MNQQNPTGQDARVPPQDLDAEKCVIACCILDATCVDQITSTLNASAFFCDAHKRIWTHILSLHSSGKPVDVVTLAHSLVATGEFQEVGGKDCLDGIMSTVPMTVNVEYYTHLVLEAAYRRQLIESARKITDDAYDQSSSCSEVLQSVESRITQLIEGRTGDEAKPLHAVLLDVIERIEQGVTPGMETGFSALDGLTGGIRGGQLIVLAARPGMGKSAFALALAKHFGRFDRPCLLHSLEMSDLEITQRLLSMDSGIPHDRIYKAEFLPDDSGQLNASANYLGNFPIMIHDQSGLSELQIASSSRLQKRKHGIQCLIVDYLQIVDPTDPKQPREQQISGMSRRFKQLAKSLDIPVILLSQLNREVEKRKDKRPLLSDLRESGAIEQDADQVWMLYRAAAAHDGEVPDDEVARIMCDYNLSDSNVHNVAELFIRKNRSGKCGAVPLMWDGDHVLFQSLSTAPEPAGVANLHQW